MTGASRKTQSFKSLIAFIPVYIPKIKVLSKNTPDDLQKIHKEHV